MKKSPLILIWINVLIGIIILGMVYLSALLSGYGSNASHLPQENDFLLSLPFNTIILPVSCLVVWVLLDVSSMSISFEARENLRRIV